MAATLGKPRLPRMQAPPIFVRYGLVIGRCVCDCQGDWINHGFEQSGYRAQLWCWKPVDQLVHVLARIAHRLPTSSHIQAHTSLSGFSPFAVTRPMR
jgi:hypothetical protein